MIIFVLNVISDSDIMVLIQSSWAITRKYSNVSSNTLSNVTLRETVFIMLQGRVKTLKILKCVALMFDSACSEHNNNIKLNQL